jgi:predicted dehydrogenase
MRRFGKPEDIKVAVIGYGGSFNMGRFHLNEVKEAGMTPCAVVDVDPERLKAASADFPGIETFSSVEKMLKDSDADLIVIITPHNTHAQLALQCINAGKHVVVEKPMAITTAECDAMIKAARRKGVALSVYHNRHWDAPILSAMKTIKEGTIGKVVRVDLRMGEWSKPKDWWRSSKSISGGILYDWGVHLIEYTLQIVNSEIVEVTGFLWSGIWNNRTVWKSDTNEDDGFVAVRYASGAWSTLAISSIESRPDPTWFKITGTKGACLPGWNTTEIITYDGDKRITTRVPNPKPEYWKFYSNIVEHLTKGKQLIITPEWARRTVHILDLACQSAKLRKALKPLYK